MIHRTFRPGRVCQESHYKLAYHRDLHFAHFSNLYINFISTTPKLKSTIVRYSESWLDWFFSIGGRQKGKDCKMKPFKEKTEAGK